MVGKNVMEKNSHTLTIPNGIRWITTNHCQIISRVKSNTFILFLFCLSFKSSTPAHKRPINFFSSTLKLIPKVKKHNA